MELPVAEMGVRLGRKPCLDSHAYHDVVRGHRLRTGADVERVVVLNRQHLLAEDDVLVLPASPFHVVAELLAWYGVELGVDEVIDASELVQIGKEGVRVGRL
jgi:hypothetical protein